MPTHLATAAVDALCANPTHVLVTLEVGRLPRAVVAVLAVAAAIVAVVVDWAVESGRIW